MKSCLVDRASWLQESQSTDSDCILSPPLEQCPEDLQKKNLSELGPAHVGSLLSNQDSAPWQHIVKFDAAPMKQIESHKL